MTKREFNRYKREIFNTVQISYTPTIKSTLALAFSGAISTFGVFSLIDGAVTGDNLSYALGAFIAILIVADTFKRGALSRFYNSIIRKQITEKGKVLKLQLGVFFLALSFMVMFDFIGSFSTANFIEQKYQDYRATSSKEYSLLQDNADNAKADKILYSQELSTWKEDKATAYQNCNDKWKGWKAKYKATCKNEWDDKPKNAKPINPNSSTSVKVEDYKEMKEGVNDDFLSRNIYNIVLFLSMALTLLLQYTTISEIQDERDEIDEMLTPQLTGTLNDRLLILETNAVDHEAERNELIRTSDQAHKTEERKFEELGEGMKVISLQKATVARGHTLQRIANNEYVPKEDAKAGFAYNPFGDNEAVKRSSKQPLNETEKREPLNGEYEKRGQNTQPLNESVITDKKETEPLNGVVKRIELKNYSHSDLELIDLLWKQATVKRNDQLETRDNVIKVIGDNKNNTLRLRNLYKKLLKDDYIYKRVGYFAKVEL